MTADEEHFSRRCAERGIRSVDPIRLKKTLETAIRLKDANVVERVFALDDLSEAWRFRVEEGIFFAIYRVRAQSCISVYTPEMMRSVRRGRKMRRKLYGRATRGRAA